MQINDVRGIPTAPANHARRGCRAPGLCKRIPLPIGWFVRMRREPIAFYSQLTRDFGDVARIQLGPVVLHLLHHPDHVKHVLQDHHKNYPRGKAYDIIKPIAGDGLLTTDGEIWQQQRRMVQPAFHPQRLACLADTMVDATKDILRRWDGFAASGTVFDIHREMARLALDIASRTMFGTDIASDADLIGQAMGTVDRYMNRRVRALLPLPDKIPLPGKLRFNRAIRSLDEVVYRIIARQRTALRNKDNLIAMLLEAQEQAGETRMSDRQMRDTVITFLVAGHETTALTLGWVWYLLSRNANARKELNAELHSVLGGRVPCASDLPKLQYTKMVIQEALRLYPPAWLFARTAARPDQIGGYDIPAKSLVLLSPFLTHRHPEFWENPEGFEPERFRSELHKNRHRCAYFPFAAGPHQCIGSEFALMEIQLVVATAMQSYTLDLVSGFTVTPEAGLALRPRDGIFVTLKRAAQSTSAAAVGASCGAL